MSPQGKYSVNLLMSPQGKYSVNPLMSPQGKYSVNPLMSPQGKYSVNLLMLPQGKYSVNLLMSFIIIIIRQRLCPVIGRRPQYVVSKLPCLVLSSAKSCRSSICPGRLSTAWLVSLAVFSCHMVSKR